MSFSERWHKFEHWGSQHPVLLGIGIVLVGGLVLWLLLPSRAPAEGTTTIAQPQGPSDAYYGYQASLAQQGNDLHIAELQTKAATDIAGIELTGLQTEVAGAVSIADLQYSTVGHVAELQQYADLQQIAATERTTGLVSTLSAQTAQAGYNRDVNVVALNTGAVTEQTRIAAQRDLGVRAYDAQVQNSSIQAQLAGLIDTNASQLAGLRDSNATAANIYNIGANRDVAISGLQLAGLRDTNATQAQIAGIGAGRDVAIAGVNLAGLRDTNAAQVELGQIASNTYLGGKIIDIYGSGVALPHQTGSFSLGGFSGGLNINPPAIENIPVRELYERAGEGSVQGQIARQYWGA